MKLTSSPISKPLIRLINLGYSGTGKSTLNVALGIPNIVPGWEGLELRVLDFDGKFEEVVREGLASFLKSRKIDQATHDKALTSNYDICPCRENTGIVRVKRGRDMVDVTGVVGKATAWNTAIRQLKTWNTTGWSPNQVLIIDSFTYAADAIVNFCQDLTNKLNQPLEWRDYQAPQQIIQSFLTQLADVPTNVIMLGHQEPMDIYRKLDEKDDKTGEPKEEIMETLVVPTSIGKAGRFKIPAQFNHMLVTAENDARIRRLWTIPKAGVMTKTPFYARAKEYYPIDTGMVEYFLLRS